MVEETWVAVPKSVVGLLEADHQVDGHSVEMGQADKHRDLARIKAEREVAESLWRNGRSLAGLNVLAESTVHLTRRSAFRDGWLSCARVLRHLAQDIDSVELPEPAVQVPEVEPAPSAEKPEPLRAKSAGKKTSRKRPSRKKKRRPRRNTLIEKFTAEELMSLAVERERREKGEVV